MRPERVSRSQFEDLFNVNPVSMDAYCLPKAGEAFYDFLKTRESFSSLYQNFDPDSKNLNTPGLAFCTSLWAYSEISQRSLEVMHKEGVLEIASMLYGIVVEQDDNLDWHRAKGISDLSCRNAFWHTNGIFDTKCFREQFAYLQTKIGRLKLPSSHIRYMKENIADAYRNCMKAEDFLRTGNPDQDLYDIHLQKANSYSVMAKAITAISNGSDCLSEHGFKIEEGLMWFELAAGHIDNELDRKEDINARSMTLPIICDYLDKQAGRPSGILSRRLFYSYLQNIPSSKVAGLLIAARYGYPYLKNINELIGSNFLLRTDTEIEELHRHN